MRQDLSREKGRLEEERVRLSQDRDALRVEEQNLECLALRIKEKSREMDHMAMVRYLLNRDTVNKLVVTIL